MARGLVCDVCGKETKEIVAKLYVAPIRRGHTRTNNSNYTASADVGICCGEKVPELVKWTKRRTRSEHDETRRLRASA